ncbi:MAG: DUF86 domain-containing protein [Archaeoglobaceae archaeon]
MNEKRIARYIDKLQHIGERTGDIENWIDDAKKDKRSRLAIYKATQEAIEASCDVISMYLKDKGYTPKDDYTNIDKWGELENNEVSECLKVANGLRNRLVHHYNGLDDNIALESIRDIIPCLIELTQVMEKWLEKNK